MKKTAPFSRQPARKPMRSRRALPVFISHCLRCGAEFDGERCPTCDPEAQTYERFTADRRYSARCACQTTMEGHRWIVWVTSPESQQPREITRCESFEAAKAAVDDYIDHQVPAQRGQGYNEGFLSWRAGDGTVNSIAWRAETMLERNRSASAKEQIRLSVLWPATNTGGDHDADSKGN